MRMLRVWLLALMMVALVGGLSPAGPAAHAGPAAPEDIIGSVVDNNGVAIAEAVVRVTADDGDFREEVTTDAQGGFTVPSPPPGDYTIEIVEEQLPEGVQLGRAGPAKRTVTAGAETKPLRIVVRRSESVRGTIFNQDGKENAPIEGLTVTVTGPDDFTGEGVTDEDGRWEVYIPGPGSYQVSAPTEDLPEGVATRDEFRYDVTVTVDPGTQKAVLFKYGADDRVITGFVGKAMASTVEGLRFGLLLALAALGLSLIFGTTGLVNFAHGELIALGAIVALVLNTGAGLHFILAAPLALALMAAFGALQELGLWRQLRRRKTGLIAMMIVTIGLSIFLRFLYLFVIGGENRAYRQYTIQESVLPAPFTLAPRDLFSIGIALVVLVGVGLMLIYSRFGKAIRAVSDNPALAAASGIDVNRVILLVWVLGTTLAGMSGIMFGLSQQVKFDMGFDLLLLVFAGVILGGLGTAFGALAGSVVVGLFVTLSTLWLPPELKNISALAVLIAILLFRPQGILGRRERIG